MNILTELRNDIRELILPMMGREVPLAITEVIEACWADERRPQLSRKKKTELGWDFYFCLPAGISFRDFAAKKNYFHDAVGNCTVEMIHAGKMAILRVITQGLKSKYLYDWDFGKDINVTSKMALPIPIGYTHRGLTIIDLADLPHMLIGGITGGGKSNIIHVIINSLIHLPVPPHIVLIDLKMVDYTYLEKHVLLVTDQETAKQSLARLVAEMRRRMKLCKDAKAVNIAKYNAKGAEKLPYIVLVIDELSELTDEDSQGMAETLLRLCRFSGICILAATQRPDRFTFSKFGTAKAQFRGRLGFACADAVASKIILDNGMAADLTDTPGRAIWRIGRECTELQTPYIDPDEAERRLPNA